MKRRFIFLIVGFGSLYYATNVYASIHQMNKAFILADLIFSPYRWLFAVLLFILGFLMFSRYIKTVIEQFDDRRYTYKEGLWCLLFLFSLLILALISILPTIIAFVLSLLYGVLDSSMYNKRKMMKEIKKEISKGE